MLYNSYSPRTSHRIDQFRYLKIQLKTECTQTEALPLFPVTPTPPKEGVPRKNGRHHRRHQTYPFTQDRIASNNYPQQDVSIQIVLPSSSMKGLPVLVKLESKGRRGSLHNDREPQTSESLPPIAAGD